MIMFPSHFIIRAVIEYKLPAIAVARIDQCRFSTYQRFSYPISTRSELPRKMASEKILLPALFKHVDENVPSYKNLLKEAVAIPSVSCDVKYRDDCVRMVHWMQDKLKEVGTSTELRDVGFQTIDGKQVKLPPVLVGVLGNASITSTLLIL